MSDILESNQENVGFEDNFDALNNQGLEILYSGGNSPKEQGNPPQEDNQFDDFFASNDNNAQENQPEIQFNES